MRLLCPMNPGIPSSDAQQNGLNVQQIQLKNPFTNGQPETRPTSNIEHVVGNGTNFNLPVGAVGANVEMNSGKYGLEAPATNSAMDDAGTTQHTSCSHHSLALASYTC